MVNSSSLPCGLVVTSSPRLNAPGPRRMPSLSTPAHCQPHCRPILGPRRSLNSHGRQWIIRGLNVMAKCVFRSKREQVSFSSLLPSVFGELNRRDVADCPGVPFFPPSFGVDLDARTVFRSALGGFRAVRFPVLSTRRGCFSFQRVLPFITQTYTPAIRDTGKVPRPALAGSWPAEEADVRAMRACFIMSPAHSRTILPRPGNRASDFCFDISTRVGHKWTYGDRALGPTPGFPCHLGLMAARLVQKPWPLRVPPPIQLPRCAALVTLEC